MNLALEKLWDLEQGLDAQSLAPQPEYISFSSVIIFTAVWSRSSAKYGDFAYNLTLLEAGHMCQNVLLAATAIKLRSRPMAAFNTKLGEQILDLDIAQEQAVYAIILGSKKTGPR